MSKYTGYVQIPHSTYDEWRNATLNNGYDVDGYYGCQCLTAGHLVKMADGTFKDVKDIKVGEIVSTLNRVLTNFKKITDVYKVITTTGNFIVSKDHRFITQDNKECCLKDIINKKLKIDIDSSDNFDIDNFDKFVSGNKEEILKCQKYCFSKGFNAIYKKYNETYILYVDRESKPECKVIDVHYIGKDCVYILNLDGNHLYYADNVLHHNCWDFASEFWWNVGFPTFYPRISQSSAYTMWTQHRLENIAYNGVIYFDLITNLNDVKRGDVLVYNQFSANPYGHVGFADQDYDTWHSANPTSYEFPILSENNGGTPDPAGGAYANVHGYDTRLFLGAFRYRPWNQPVPPTPTVEIEHQFPWVLYARKFRSRRKR